MGEGVMKKAFLYKETENEAEKGEGNKIVLSGLSRLEAPKMLSSEVSRFRGGGLGSPFLQAARPSSRRRKGGTDSKERTRQQKTVAEILEIVPCFRGDGRRGA